MIAPHEPAHRTERGPFVCDAYPLHTLACVRAIRSRWDRETVLERYTHD